MPKKSKKEEAFLAAHVETVGYLVTRDGLACKLVNVSGSHKGGVLLPGAPVITWLKVRDARRALQRTVKVRENMRTSMVSEWLLEQMPSFLAGEEFAIVAIGRQG